MSLASQSAILGCHLSALVCTPDCLRKFLGRREKGPSRGSGGVFNFGDGKYSLDLQLGPRHYDCKSETKMRIAMKKLFVTGVAALFLATGTAHAAEQDTIGGKWCMEDFLSLDDTISGHPYITYVPYSNVCKSTVIEVKPSELNSVLLYARLGE